MNRRAASAFRAVLSLCALFYLGAPAAPAQPSEDPPTLVRRADAARLSEDWYGAVELYLAALAANPTYSDAVTGLAEAYYALEEYDQALVRVTDARRLKGDDPSLLVMEAFIRIGMGDTDQAAELFRTVLEKNPNDLETRFGLALLDLRAGRSTDARARLSETLRISPRNARALLSLALISADSGRMKDAETYLESALQYHAQDPRTYYVAARLACQSGRIEEAVARAKVAVELKPVYPEARRLLASLLLETGDPESAARLMEEAISRDRKDALAWYTLGLAQTRQGHIEQSIYAFETALNLRPDDEIARRALEDLVIDELTAEDSRRPLVAAERFARARQFESNREYERALSEYRRGLRVDPYSKPGRERYAELLRLRGRPSSYLAELEFLKSLDKADTRILDAAENYSSALSGAVGRSWGMDQLLLSKRPYTLAVFSLPSPESAYHPGAGAILVRALRDELARSSRFSLVASGEYPVSFSDAFRAARDAGADWFVLVRTQETERDIRIQADVYVARTGSPASTFSSLRSGNERVSRAVSSLNDVLESAPPLRGTFLRRDGDRALVDLGTNDGVAVGDILNVVRKGALSPGASGVDIQYEAGDITAEIEITRTDEEVSEGLLRRVGYLDRSNLEDSVVRKPKALDKDAVGAAKPTVSEPFWTGLFEEVRRLK